MVTSGASRYSLLDHFNSSELVAIAVPIEPGKALTTNEGLPGRVLPQPESEFLSRWDRKPT
jgi:hypothetical protein